MWNKTKIITEVKEASDIIVEFVYEGNKEIKTVNKSCGCTKAKWVNPDTLQLIINTGLVKDNVHPNLLKEGKDYYFKYATVDIIYGDNSKETLKVEAKVTKVFD